MILYCIIYCCGGEQVNIANILTVIRLAMVPVFAGLLAKDLYILAAVVFISAGLTDIADGFIARKYNMVTSWGKIADPLADKLMVITALFILTVQEKIPIAVIIIMILKEILMGLGSYLIYRNKKFVVSANWYGKLSTFVFYVAIVLTIFNSTASGAFMALAVVSALFALARYIIDYYRKNKVEKTGSAG